MREIFAKFNSVQVIERALLSYIKNDLEKYKIGFLFSDDFDFG